MTHPDDETLRAWMAGQLSDVLTASVEEHLQQCDRCAGRLDALGDPNAGLARRIRALDWQTEQDNAARPTLSGSLASELTIDGDIDPQVAAAATQHWGGAVSTNLRSDQTIKLDLPDVTSTADLVIKPRAMHSPQHHLSDQQSEYELLDVLGEGGMGVIYSARQSSMDRRVAVKMLKEERTQKADRGQFLEEAVITAELEHPNIVPIHELGSNQKGALFYAMKQIEGQAWRDVIGDKSLEENVEIWMRVADAIAFAHSRGIIHRDLKPENIMLGQFGEVLVMDWGLAHVPTGDPTPKLKSMPRSGGTPAYMAPEMVTKPNQIQPSSDIYLLGSILLEMLTGWPPHSGTSVMKCLLAAAANKICEAPPKETFGKRGIQYAALMEIAQRALATLPEDRYQSVTEMQQAVRDWMVHSESLVIAERSERLLKTARENDRHDDFVRAIFGFEQACELYPANESAAKLLPEAKLAYAQSAAEKGDYDLAASLLDPQISDHAKLLISIESSREELRLRQSYLQTQRIALQLLTGATVVLLLLGLLVTSWLRAGALELANRNQPAMNQSLRLQSGLRRSLSELRGWVVLGEKQFKSGRRAAWRDEILPPLISLKQLPQSDSDRRRLDQLKLTLHDLYEAQWWAEDVAQTPGNLPATELRYRVVTPVEESISEALASIVLLEQQSAQPQDLSRGRTPAEHLFGAQPITTRFRAVSSAGLLNSPTKAMLPAGTVFRRKPTW